MDSRADPHVKILLSTRDGASFVDTLVESIQWQSYANWSLVCRDDGSTDDTRDRLLVHATSDSRITVLPDDYQRLGPSASFMSLLGEVQETLFAFCDQDDVWEPHKLEWSVAELGSAESVIAAVYSDVFVADSHARVVAPSALRQRGVRHPPAFAELLMVNAAIGATIVGTPELAKAAVSLVADPWMHDWWCALVAAYAGELRLVPYPLLRWRRHDATVTDGTAKSGGIDAAARLEYLRWSSRAARILDDSGFEPRNSDIARAATTLGEIDRHGMSIRRLTHADRVGVRAWPSRRRAAVFGAAGLQMMGRLN